jgi:magnesium transporter
MSLYFVTSSAVEEHAAEAAETLLTRVDGYVWLDVPAWDSDVGSVVKSVFGFHPVAIEMCRERNHMAMVHGYADHIFVVLHRPVLRESGHTHLVELDLFVGDNYLVTVHGPTNPAVAHEEVMAEVRETLARMHAGRIWPTGPLALAHAVISLIALRQRVLVQQIATRVADVERRVLSRSLTDPETSLEEMFLVRHELLTVRTMASHSREVLARMRVLLRARSMTDDLIADLEDMFERVHRMTDGEQEFLAGVIELFRTRTDTKMMIAMERLAVLAAVTLPITALASVLGMNVIVNNETRVGQLVAVLLVMMTISGVLLRWTKKQGWW